MGIYKPNTRITSHFKLDQLTLNNPFTDTHISKSMDCDSHTRCHCSANLCRERCELHTEKKRGEEKHLPLSGVTENTNDSSSLEKLFRMYCNYSCTQAYTNIHIYIKSKAER